MKTLLAAIGLSLLSGAAMAGEGTGNPFPFTAPPLSVSMQGYKQAASKIQDPMPFATPGVRRQIDVATLPTSAEGEVQTANSLPVGAGESEGPVTALANRNAAPAQIATPFVQTTPRG